MQFNSKVLVIDDEEVVLSFVSRVLRSAGYETLEASNGEEGLQMFQEQCPALVITDLVMPEMEGLETIVQMRRQAPDARVIAMTGAMPSRFLGYAEEFGAVQTLKKPFTRTDVLSAVRSALEPPTTV